MTVLAVQTVDQYNQLLGVLDELVEQPQFRNVQFVDLPAEKLSEVFLKHEIETMPTVIFFRGRKAVDRMDGVNIEALIDTYTKLARIPFSSTSPPPPAAKAPSLDDDERLRAITKKDELMIFMKGNRDAPRCEFSKEMIRLMNATGNAALSCRSTAWWNKVRLAE